MTVVFFAFTFTTDRNIKIIGLGMAAAVLIDALLVRTVLVPAVMHTLGKSNWRLPRSLDRRLPHLDLEDSGETAGGRDGAGADAPEGAGELRPAAKA
jgi:RND superfamily putative drug exporter